MFGIRGRELGVAGSWSGADNITRSAWFDGSADYLSRANGLFLVLFGSPILAPAVATFLNAQTVPLPKPLFCCAQNRICNFSIIAVALLMLSFKATAQFGTASGTRFCVFAIPQIRLRNIAGGCI